MALMVCAPDPEPPDRAPLSSPAGMSGRCLVSLIAAYQVIMHMIMGGVQESMLLQKVVAACPDDQSQSTSFGNWHERNLQRSFCSSCRMTPGCFAKHIPIPSMMHAPGILLATSVTCLYTQECQLRQGRQRMHVVACAPTRGDQRLQPAARASAVARAVRRQLRARRMAVEGQHVVRRHVACE